MKRVLLLVLVAGLMMVTTGCSFLENLTVEGAGFAFFTAWYASTPESAGTLTGFMKDQVTLNGTSMTSEAAAQQLANGWWEPTYTKVGDPVTNTEITAGVATHTRGFSVIDTNAPATEIPCTLVLTFTKVSLFVWKISEISVNDWRIN